tara:strand:+ start:163 stop:297 length:135 start_codon:yes stop_codon:yes gene_type:complete
MERIHAAVENISFANPLKKPATEKAKMTLKENQSITNIRIKIFF